MFIKRHLKNISVYILCAALFALILNPMQTFAGTTLEAVPQINAESAVVYSVDTGEKLVSFKSNDKYYPIGVTKIMTAIIAVENAEKSAENMPKSSEKVTVGKEILTLPDGYTSAGFKVGDVVSFPDLITAAIVSNADDAAIVIGVYIGRKKLGGVSNYKYNYDKDALEYFVSLMNRKIQLIGLTQTTFTNCTGHLWFLQQEMLMLLLTGIKLMVRCKYNDLVCVAVLLIITFLTWKYLTVSVFSLRANNGNGVFRIWQFTVGMAAAYVYRAYKISNLQWNKHRSVRMIFDVLALLLLLGCVLSSNSVLSRFDERFAKYYIGWQLPLWCSSLTGILILLLLLNPTGFLSKLLGNKVFVFLGKISFGIYLIHFFLIPYVSLGSAYKNFICIYGVSTCIAYALHILIEKPFTVFAKTKSLKQLLEYYQNL